MYYFFLVLLWIVGMPPNLLIPSLSYSRSLQPRRKRRQWCDDTFPITKAKKEDFSSLLHFHMYLLCSEKRIVWCCRNVSSKWDVTYTMQRKSGLMVLLAMILWTSELNNTKSISCPWTKKTALLYGPIEIIRKRDSKWVRCTSSPHPLVYWRNPSTFQIKLVRRRTPVLLQTYLPSGLFVVVSWISFIVPPEIVPGKTRKHIKRSLENNQYLLACRIHAIE